MIDWIKFLLVMCAVALPFLLFVLLNAKANLPKKIRNRQLLMPIVALVYGIAAVFLLSYINQWIAWILSLVPGWLDRVQSWSEEALNGNLSFLGEAAAWLAEGIRTLLASSQLMFWLCIAANAVIMLVFLIVKKLLLAIFKRVFGKSTALGDTLSGLFYAREEEGSEVWYVRPHLGQARTYLKFFYYGAVGVSILAMLVSGVLYRNQLLGVPFYPVFAILILGEMYFFVDGLLKGEEEEDQVEGEDDEAKNVVNYSLLRKALRKLFGDKLQAEGTDATHMEADLQTNEELLHAWQAGSDGIAEAYSLFMQGQVARGGTLDRNYLVSGLELLQGKSILFNNPFYYDLIPYVSYSMNRTLLRNRKVLVVLGRHGIQDDLQQWCEDGLTAVTNVEQMWRVGVLTRTAQELDVGIVTRSSVHDLKLHEANEDFFSQVEFVVLVEPSRLITTAQIGLNSLVQACRREGKNITFCSVDKNCDGLVDALSHILMTSLSEVAATNRYDGVCSYMCWETDREHLQHRMLPNVSRYLGVGTELSFAGLKHQVAHTAWYGGEAFPVTDMHWIVKQYYYDLLHYAGLPISQKSIDDYFQTSPNLWNARIQKNQYITVEDESCNMFEIKRDFSTRATEQSFINIISPEYLLKDYMADNGSIFNTDPKAIPYVVADYARTVRNVVLRLCLRMSAGMVPEEEVRQELMLVEQAQGKVEDTFWDLVCSINRPISSGQDDTQDRILRREAYGKTLEFGPDVICVKKKFSMKTGKMERYFHIADPDFKQILLWDLQSASYIAEDEHGERQYLGTELRGQIFQKYLPGQFFTFHGKYYEMQSVTTDGRILLRRAADHITGRRSYRQQRSYVITRCVDAQGMGDQREVNGMRVIRQYADLQVDTPAYWEMDRYNDFVHGRKVLVNGIPRRTYYNKRILRVDLPQPVDGAVCQTIALLFDEIFRTMFAENHPYIAVTVASETELPFTYRVAGQDGVELNPNSLYFIEDSQMDLGLLEAVERNLTRVLEIIWDYLDWHMEQVEQSLNPPQEPEVPDYTLPEPPEGTAAEPEPKTWIGRLWKKIKSFFRRIGEFFQKLFRRKKKTEEPEEPTGQEPEEPTGQESEEPAGQEPEEPTGQEPEEPTGQEPEEPTGQESEEPTGQEPEESAGQEPEEPADQQPKDAPLQSRSMYSSAMDESQPNDANDTLEYEPEKVLKPTEIKTMERKPYHERYYLLYGGTQVPEQLDVQGTWDYLKEHGYADGSLKQARSGKEIAEMIENNYDPRKPGSHFCDFCGVELMGTDYQVLSDGRERCTTCGKTSVKTAQEFDQLYRTIARNMEAFFGARIMKPVRVQMVNSKKLHKKLGKTFVPTGKFDGRILGVAIRDGDGYSILVENGAPRLSSIMTIAHELTHIWQYLHWDDKEIVRKYGKDMELEVYEGMAKWVEIQYAYLIGEPAAAKREEISARLREDEYGRGFRKYVARYPLSMGTQLEHSTPFEDRSKPL